MSLEQAAAFVAQMAPIAALVPGDRVRLGIAGAGSDRLIGDVGVYLEAGGTSAALGFTLGREAQGRGHAVRAVEVARSIVFACSAAVPVRAVTDARNQGSVRALESAGFARLALRQALFKGERCTEFVYVCHRAAAEAAGRVDSPPPAAESAIAAPSAASGARAQVHNTVHAGVAITRAPREANA